ncbi:hypothetical protein HPB50_018519 [Hyalomma asiaticum]|uniref:Uncharacterized protein n=1 Tax=Hyalomma asiaticum TaxID=266040 RepID=A0ACB7TMB1_HYAAI|nr:hypothetical protein HPB50_018519 [Hyalomma asiaticum]
MRLVNWSEATPEDLAGFTADFLREELVRRDLDTAGSKEEVIYRLIADIAENLLTTSQLPSPDSAAPSQRPNTTSPPTFDAAQSTELLTGLLQQLLHVSQRAAAPVQVTTLPDLSASLPTYTQRPETVAAYMDIVTHLDQTLSHSSRRLSRPVYSSAKLSTPSPQAPRHIEERMNVQAVSDKTRAPQRISALGVDQQEARYLTISARHGAPAYRPGQNLAEAVCFQCHQKGHLESKCPSGTTAPPSTTHPSPALHSTLSETLDGSLVQPPLVVGGTTVAPAGAIHLKISVGPITGLVEAAALDNNAVPLILGEDWFSASHAQLVFQPPMPTEIRHSTTETSVRGLPSTAMYLDTTAQEASSEFRSQAQMNPHGCIDPSLPAAQIGSHMPAHQEWEIRSILSMHAEVFAREEGDLGQCHGLGGSGRHCSRYECRGSRLLDEDDAKSAITRKYYSLLIDVQLMSGIRCPHRDRIAKGARPSA